MEFLELKDFLDLKFVQYNQQAFIENDPICIPHRFVKKQDIEIAAFFAAILAWGQRKTIINKCTDLFHRMDNAPYEFMLHHGDEDLKGLLGFKHRTFNDTDLLYFVAFFKAHYQNSDSLETAFIPQLSPFREEYLSELNRPNFEIEQALNHFRTYFFSLEDYPTRTIKHVSSPAQKSTCKRLNMFLRWMVRKDNCGVDFGIWTTLKPKDLICPCDVHVDRVARRLNLISRKQTDWQTALELTTALRKFDPADPVKYDFALFGLGVEEKF
ncbi:TIGR02757 family protein [Pedobacter sp.]|uniref:TIGR02757 family protein n=1 Tax=Pedobacter sp. TaxID=1411316 RepID=UPI003D7F6892